MRETVVLTDDTRPMLSIGAREFERQVRADDGWFWGVPGHLFNVRGHDVYVDARFASLLLWAVDERLDGGSLNVNTVAQSVTLDGERIDVPAGALCAFISGDSVRTQ